MNNRIRYGKITIQKNKRATKSKPAYTETNKLPKNTLLTIRDGELVHFGIARCNIDLDRFSKNTGKLIATNRANLAAREEYTLNSVGLKIHHSGLRGTVELANIVALLQYFQNVDLELKNRAIQ